MKRLVVELDDKEHQEIKEKAVKKGRSMKDIFLELIRKWLKGE